MSQKNGRGNLYEYAVLYHPEPKKDAGGNEETAPSEIVVDLTRVVAKDESVVAMQAARTIPEEYAGELDRCEILVRGF